MSECTLSALLKLLLEPNISLHMLTLIRQAVLINVSSVQADGFGETFILQKALF